MSFRFQLKHSAAQELISDTKGVLSVLGHDWNAGQADGESTPVQNVWRRQAAELTERWGKLQLVEEPEKL